MTSPQIPPDLSTFFTEYTRDIRGNIPLTTIFTPPSSCSSAVTFDGTWLWQGGAFQLGDQNCYPPLFRDTRRSWYSPGICPYHWTSVPVTVDKPYEEFCCPSSYFVSQYTHRTGTYFVGVVCVSPVSSTLTNVYATSTMGEGPVPRDATLTAVDLDSVPFQAVFADVVQVRWAETDSEILHLRSQAGVVASGSHVGSSTTALSTSLLTATSSTPETAARPVVAPPTTTSPPKPSSATVSPGIKAGIAVGATVGSLTVAVLAFLFWRRQRQNIITPRASNQFFNGGISEIADSAGIGQYNRWRAELASQAPELPHDHVRIELDSRPI